MEVKGSDWSQPEHTILGKDSTSKNGALAASGKNEESNVTYRKLSIDMEKSANGSGDRKHSMTGNSKPRKSRNRSQSRKHSVFEKPIDLDQVLVNELGQFGRYQLYTLMLVAIPIIMSAFVNEYIFSAAAIPHRCLIPECGETSTNAVYDNLAVAGAFPESESCARYVPVGNGTPTYCPSSLFDQYNTIPCDGFVYERTNSVVYQFDLGCEDWLRALAGTLNSVGTLLVLPITGYVSDRFGRRVALIISVFNIGLFGLIRAFSVNYPMYLALQLLQTTFGSGAFSSAYIILTEMVGPKFRVATSATITSMFAVGQVVVGSVAYLVQPWRYMIMALHIPCLLIIVYHWFLNESVRWLLSKEKYDEARAVLEKVARVNKKQISEKSLQALMSPPKPAIDEDDGPGLIATIWRSPILLRRVCTTPIWWITTILVYYGLSINSTNLLGTNMYLSYILTCAIEVPAYFTAIFILDRIGRRPTLFIGYFLSAACNFCFSFMPDTLPTLSLIVFLLGKYGISVVMTSMYLFTAELYPTQFRHSLLAFSSMIGRVGSITAPLTPVLATYWSGIPTMMFGSMGLLSGVLVLTQPETLGTRLPDTLAEAEALGTHESKLKQES